MLGLQHLLFSVTDPQFRVKPAGVSDVSSSIHYLSFRFSFKSSMWFIFLAKFGG